MSVTTLVALPGKNVSAVSVVRLPKNAERVVVPPGSVVMPKRINVATAVVHPKLIVKRMGVAGIKRQTVVLTVPTVLVKKKAVSPVTVFVV